MTNRQNGWLMGMTLVLALVFHAAMQISGLLAGPQPERIGPPRERPAEIEVVDGIYAYAGEDALKPYRGAGTLLRRDKCYILRTTNGVIGIGVRKGDTLSVGWQGGQVCIFKIEANGKLTGEWANGDGQLYPEVWELLKRVE